MRILVGTLYSGENELDRCVEALHGQDHHEWDHFVVEHLPEREAHETLYRRFMEAAGDFDLFLKLDADMVFADARKLSRVVALFDRSPSLDHAVFRVQDWMSARPIIGLHVYSRRVVWSTPRDRLFPDLPPTFAGRRRYVMRSPSPLALHSPDPSEVQAFHYGLHRGLKAFQPGRPAYALAHWRLLKHVWRHFDRTRERRLGLALLGVEHALARRPDAADCSYTSPALAEAMAPHASLDAETMHTQLAPNWATPLRRERRWLRNVMRGPAAASGASSPPTPVHR